AWPGRDKNAHLFALNSRYVTMTESKLTGLWSSRDNHWVKVVVRWHHSKPDPCLDPPDYNGSIDARLEGNSKAFEPDLALDFALGCGSGRNDQLQPLGVTTGRGHTELDF